MNLCKANPFQHAGFWYWTDESALSHGPYHTQIDALRGLMKHIDPPLPMRLWNMVKEFLCDTRG